MNTETLLMCVQMTARQQLAALGCVSDEVQALLDELTPAPVAEEPAAEVQQVAPEEQSVEVQQVAVEEPAAVVDAQPAE